DRSAHAAVLAGAALVELDAPVLSEAQRGGAASAVSADGENSDRGQALLHFQAHACAGKLPVLGALTVAQELEGRGGVEGLIEPLGESRLGLLDLGPGRVQQVIRKSVDARLYARRSSGATIGDEVKRVGVP